MTTRDTQDQSRSAKTTQEGVQPTIWSAHPDNPATANASGEHQARTAIDATLQAARKILYRSSGLSSPHETLEETAKLLFAHVSSIDNGGAGIGKQILEEPPSPANALQRFVSEAFQRTLPRSASFEIRNSDFDLKLRPNEDRLASELINCFTQNAKREHFTNLRAAGQLDILNDVFSQFLTNSFVDEKELGQYLTPTEVVRTMVALGLDSLADDTLEAMYSLDPARRPGVILDPSCGVGSFLAETLRALYAEAKNQMPTEDLHTWMTSVLRNNITGIDKSERMIRLATANLALFGAPTTNLHLANSLLRVGNDGKLCAALDGQAALILTNPPFGARFPSADLHGYQIANGENNRPRQSVTSEILFMERYLEWLAPDGVLVTIVPDSVLTNRGIFSELRSTIARTAELLSVVSLPASTFAAAGTSTKTSILHLRKSQRQPRSAVYFAICQNVGYDVVTKATQRRRIPKAGGQLPQILDEATNKAATTIGQWALPDDNTDRWDATYHAGVPDDMLQRIKRVENTAIRVRDVASLSTDRWDPRDSGPSDFKYVEISNVDAQTVRVNHNAIQSSEAPSRARKVVREGDVLVSTVRPERRTVGVVGPELDGAICSTGFAVLRPERINAHVLARLLQSDFANAQIVRHAAGIAYPAVDEHYIADTVLPIDPDQLGELSDHAENVAIVRNSLRTAEAAFISHLDEAMTLWLGE